MSDTPSRPETQAPSEMVLRVAIAIAAVWGHPASAWSATAFHGGKLSQKKRDLFLDAAHKAIEAMREPSEEMIEIGHWAARMPDTGQSWRAMIDAALGERR